MSSYVTSSAILSAMPSREKTSQVVANAASSSIVHSTDQVLAYMTENGHPCESPRSSSAAGPLLARFDPLPGLGALRRDLRPVLPVLRTPQPVLRRPRSSLDSHVSPDAGDQSHYR